jgi:hypothetical protein
MKTLSRLLHELSYDPVLTRLFAATPWSTVVDLAASIDDDDVYRERAAIRAALTACAVDPLASRAHVEHQLWCAWRDARWSTGTAEPLEITVEGLGAIAETDGSPTLLVTPMTLGLVDALHAISMLRRDRPCLVFGEEVEHPRGAPPGVELVSAMASGTVRRIHHAMAARATLCTYVDFVYAGHASETIELFGTTRPMSAGFLSLGARDGTMLLPVVAVRHGEGIHVVAEEPLQVALDHTASAEDRAATRAAIALECSDMLERLIRRAPEQWRLLPTLCAESPQMARGQVTAPQAARETSRDPRISYVTSPPVRSELSTS